MGIQKTRSSFNTQINDPASGITSTNTNDISAVDHNIILDDLSESVFFILEDTTDDITEGSSNLFLKVVAQTIDGVKTFSAVPVANLGIQLKESGTDTNTVKLIGNSSLGSSYTIKLPSTTPSAGEVLSVQSYSGGIATMGFSAAGGGTINSGTANRVAIYSGGTVISDIGTGTITGTTLTIASQSGKTFTIPVISASSANVLLSEENQTINGVKDFQSITNLKGFTLESVGGGKITLNATGAVTPYTLTLPSAQGGVNSLMVNDAGTMKFLTVSTPGTGTANGIEIGTNVRLHNATSSTPGIVSTSSQVLSGEKTFNNGLVVGSSNPTIKINNGTAITTLQSAASSSYTLNLPTNAGSASQALTTDGAGNLSWSTIAGSGTINSGTTGRVALYTAGTTLDDTLSGGASIVVSGSRTYTMPASSFDTDIIVSDTGATQDIDGVIHFNDAPFFRNPSATKFLIGDAGSPAFYITATALGTDRVVNLPDPGATAEFVLSEGATTINGAKTFTAALSALSVTATTTSNQLVLGSGNTVTINSAVPASSRIHTIPDTTSTEFIMGSGNQTIGGTKTFTSTPAITNTTSAFVLSSASNTATIKVASQAVAREYTIPDASANTEFVLSAGTQTISGNKTFSGSSVFNSNITINASNIVTDTTTGLIIGTSALQKLGFFGATPVVQSSILPSIDAGAINSGDATTDTIISDLRTGYNQLRSLLSSLGLTGS